jgi:hypothetical protein
MTSLFFSYSHADENLRDMLEKHLAALKHQGLIDTWHDRRIEAGTELHGEIDKNLNSAEIILLLVSADFIASKYCYDVEMARAIERHAAGEARVIPVILRACDWHDTPFAKLMATPKDGKAIVSWADIDEAFLDVVTSIKKVLRSNSPVTESAAARLTPMMIAAEPAVTIVERPRSANLRTRKTFTEADRDQFLDEAFNYMASYFENSLKELENRNADLTTRFKRIDGNSFTAVIYQNGDAISRCKIRLGGALGNGISYSANDHAGDNSFNENLSVEFDDQHMFLKPLGMAMQMAQQNKNLSAEGASEFYWSMLMQYLQ